MSGAGRILACGGHDFDRRSGNEAITDLLVELAGGSGSRICLLPTASGDAEDQITRFRRAFGERGAEPHVISLFRLGEKPVELREELLDKDAIFVGGGSMVNLLAIWRAHGLDDVMRECLRGGVLIGGSERRGDVLVRPGHHQLLGGADGRGGTGLPARQRLRPLSPAARQAPHLHAGGRRRAGGLGPRLRGPDGRPVRGRHAGGGDDRARGRPRVEGERRGLGSRARRRWFAGR